MLSLGWHLSDRLFMKLNTMVAWAATDLTSARHDVFHKSYSKKYPESFDNDIPDELVYSGSKLLTDPSEVDGVNIGKLVLSPTRTYAPVIRQVLENFRSEYSWDDPLQWGRADQSLEFY